MVILLFCRVEATSRGFFTLNEDGHVYYAGSDVKMVMAEGLEMKNHQFFIDCYGSCWLKIIENKKLSSNPTSLEEPLILQCDQKLSPQFLVQS